MALEVFGLFIHKQQEYGFWGQVRSFSLWQLQTLIYVVLNSVRCSDTGWIYS